MKSKLPTFDEVIERATSPRGRSPSTPRYIAAVRKILRANERVWRWRLRLTAATTGPGGPAWRCPHRHCWIKCFGVFTRLFDWQPATPQETNT